MKKMPIFRILFSVVALGLFCFGIYCIIGGLMERHDINDKKDLLAMDMSVDFSVAGEYTAVFDQVWSGCHGQTIDLSIPVEKKQVISQDKLFEVLKFDWQITDSNGEVVIEGTSEDGFYGCYKVHKESIVLIYFMPIPCEKYQFNLNITEGFAELAAVKQRLKSRYHPCGLEMLIVVLAVGIGVVSIIIGTVITAVVVSITKRKRKSGGKI